MLSPYSRTLMAPSKIISLKDHSFSNEKVPILTRFDFFSHRSDMHKIEDGQTVSVNHEQRGWNMEVGYDRRKFNAKINDVE